MDATTQLLNHYTIAGSLVPLTYNDQADDRNRMVNLINDAQMEIATTNRPIECIMTYVVPEEPLNTPITDIVVDFPEDFCEFQSIRFTPVKGHNRQSKYARYYKRVGEHYIILPSKPAGTYEIEYSRFPVRYTKDTPLTTELDNTPDTHEAIPYFVAAMIAIDDNPKLYYALYNVWETRLARMGLKQAHAESTQVDDLYGFSDFRGIW